jgi:hypothetical protein
LFLRNQIHATCRRITTGTTTKPAQIWKCVVDGGKS